MAIHIGELIQQEVELKRLTYKQFGEMIHRNEKTIPDIYDRASMSVDLLITICGALKKDFFSVYYSEEPLRSLRNDEVVLYINQVREYKAQLEKLTELNNNLHKELELTKELNKAQREIISYAKEQIEQNKLTIKELSNTVS